MFLLNKSVLFGPKKGTSSTYYTIVSSNSSFLLKTLTSSSTLFKSPLTTYQLNQHSLFSSRFTSLILLTFWLVFSFSGEYLLLLLMNFSTPIDSIYSSFFLNFSSFTCYSTANTSFYTLDSVFSYVLLSTLLAIKFLYMFKFKNTRNSLGLFFLIDFIIFIFIFTKL